MSHTDDFSPASDGVDHIRIHPRALTTLGRLLCHGAHTAFIHPVHGRFASMEGYWQFVRTGCRHNPLRLLTGERAYSAGIRHSTVKCKQFRDLILEGLSCKIYQHQRLQELLVLSSLPFVQYTQDLYGEGYLQDHSFAWCLEGVSEVRQHLLSVRPRPLPRCGLRFGQLLEESLLGYSSPIIA